jgi:hypothetical protein
MSDLITTIAKLAIQIMSQQLGGPKELVIADSLVDIVTKAMAAYREETGLDIDPAKLRPYEPI